MRFNDFKLTPSPVQEAAADKLKHGSTRGHMGEYLLGAAVVAKFIKGADPIKPADVVKVMKKTSSTESLSATFKSNEGDVIDFVNIIKNKKNIADAMDVTALVSVMNEELDGAVAFANSDIAATKWSRVIAANGRPDSILVKAAGEEDQSGTKADIFLIYKQEDGTEKVLKGWSLKTGSNLIGQGSPRTFDNMVVFFKELGVDLVPIEDYDEHPDQHIASVMKQVSQELNGFTAGDDDNKELELIQRVINFMSVHLTQKDPRVYIVNLGKGAYTAQTIRTMAKNLPTVDLESSLSTKGRPELLVHDKGNIKDVLFKIRYTYSASRVNSKGKTTPERHRMFVETGPLFKKLATISAPQDVV